jgi:hypothetical protein
MKKYYILNITFFLLILTSCDNNEDIEPTYDYIKFDTDDKSFLLNSEYDAFWNTYFKGSNQDQLGLVMQDESGELLGQIFLNNSDFSNKTFPFTVDIKSDPLKDGSAQMSLINLVIRRDTIFNETDNINYTNHSGDNFTLTINSFENSVLKGEFFGVLKTKTGKTKPIDNGRFKIKVERK